MQQQQNCEKTTPISSTTNQWSQNNNQITIIDDHKSFMASSAAPNKVLTMEKTNQAAADPHQQPLKCPRCDSANTKFCYYNNYSLSQPRHFCKACKRYWTRGGTLRNVPVGGGCRKNKRVKRSTSSQPSDGISSSGAAVGSGPATANPSSRSHIDLSPLSSHLNNPLFNYNLPTNTNIPMEMSFPFSRFRLSSSSGFDIDQPPQMNGVGLGFSSGIMSGNHEYNNEFRQIQDHGISASRLLSNPTNLFGSSSSSTSFASTSSTTASLLASSLQQQKFGSSSVSGFPGLMPYDYQEMHQMGKEVKDEGENMRSDWNHENILGGGGHDEQINNPSHDSSSLLWNSMTNNGGGGGGGGVWFDASNIGSSVQSLI